MAVHMSRSYEEEYGLHPDMGWVGRSLRNPLHPGRRLIPSMAVTRALIYYTAG